MDEDEHSFYLEFLTQEADFWKEVKKRTREIDPSKVVRLPSRHKGDGVLAGCNS